VRNTLLPLLAATLVLSAPTSAPAEDMKPLLVVSYAGFDQLVKDLDFLADLGGEADLGLLIDVLVSSIEGASLEALDRTKPWGLVLGSDGQAFQILGFLPINDLPKFLAGLPNLGGGASDEGDGVHSIDLQGIRLFFKQKGDWTYVSIATEFFQQLPDDPTKLLADLDTKHKLAGVLHIANIPEAFRQVGVETIRSMLSDLPKTEGESDAQYELRKRLSAQQLDSMATWIDDAEVIRFGSSVDDDARKALVDVVMKPKGGSAMAGNLAKQAGLTSNFAGFMLPEASIAFSLNTILGERDKVQAKANYELLREEAHKQLNAIAEVPGGEIKSAIDKLVDEFFDLGFVTIDGCRLDGGVAFLGPGPFTLVAGFEATNAAQLSQFLDKVARLLETEIGFAGLQRDVDKHEGVKFHSISVPLPGGPEGDQLVELFGHDLEVTFGFGERSAYLAVGKDGLAALKRAIDASKSTVDKPAPAMQLTASLAAVEKVLGTSAPASPPVEAPAAGGGGNGNGAQQNGEAKVDSPAANDIVRVTAQPTAEAMSWHIELDEAPLGAILSQVMSLAPSLGGL